MATNTPRQQNQPAQQGGQTQGRTIGAIIREEIENGLRQKVRGIFDHPAGATGIVVQAGFGALSAIADAIKQGDVEKAINVAVAAGITIPQMERLIKKHRDIFPAPEERGGNWLEDIIDMIAPNWLLPPDDPEVIALQTRRQARRRTP